MTQLPDSIKQRWTAEITVRNWTQFDHQLAIEGYIAVAPAKAHEPDKGIAELTYCPDCGDLMQYRPRFLSNPGTYRPFAVCEGCNIAAEF